MSVRIHGRLIRAVIFDMDGLMLDSERLAQRAWQQASRDAGYDLSDDVFRVLVGRTIGDVRYELSGAFGENYPLDDIYYQKQTLFEEYIIKDGLSIKAGLLALVDKLDSLSIRKAIASSSSCDVIERNLRVVNIPLTRFDVLVGGDEVINGKPAPDIYLKAAKYLNEEPENCLVFEDSNAGVQAACAAGMLTVMVPDLVSPDENSLSCAYKIVPSLDEFISLLDDSH